MDDDVATYVDDDMATVRHGYPWVPTVQDPGGPCQVDPTRQKPHQPTSGPEGPIHNPYELGRLQKTLSGSRRVRKSWSTR
jgi:hypothetical protein